MTQARAPPQLATSSLSSNQFQSPIMGVQKGNEMNNLAIIPPTALIERHELKTAIETAILAIETRTAHPILKNVSFDSAGGNLFITGTDLDIEVTTTLHVDGDICTTIPAKQLNAILKGARPCDYVQLSDEGVTAVIELEKSSYTIETLPIREFPKLEFEGVTSSFTIAGAEFWSILNRVKPAISTEEARYYLNGVYLHHDDQELNFVATDGHRLSMQTISAPVGLADNVGVIIPTKTIKILHKLTKGKLCPDQVHVQITPSKARFQVGNVTITTKLIDGTFPDYKRLLNSDSYKTISFDCKAMISAINDATLKTKNAKFTIEVSNNIATVKSVGDNVKGQATVDVDCDIGKYFLCFNASYFAQALQMAETETVQIKVGETGSPAFVTGEVDGWLGLIMPVRP